MRKIIRLTEQDLFLIVKRVLNEQKNEPTGLNIVMNPNVKKLMKDKWGRPYRSKNGKMNLWYGFDEKSGKWVDGSCKGLSGKTDQNKCREKLGLASKSVQTKPDVDDSDDTPYVSGSGDMGVY